MFKKIIAILISAFYLATSYASKARLESLQQIDVSNGDISSYYLGDERSILLNPSYMNKYKNFHWYLFSNSQYQLIFVNFLYLFDKL